MKASDRWGPMSAVIASVFILTALTASPAEPDPEDGIILGYRSVPIIPAEKLLGAELESFKIIGEPRRENRYMSRPEDRIIVRLMPYLAEDVFESAWPYNWVIKAVDSKGRERDLVFTADRSLPVYRVDSDSDKSHPRAFVPKGIRIVGGPFGALPGKSDPLLSYDLLPQPGLGARVWPKVGSYVSVLGVSSRGGTLRLFDPELRARDPKRGGTGAELDSYSPEEFGVFGFWSASNHLIKKDDKLSAVLTSIPENAVKDWWDLAGLMGRLKWTSAPPERLLATARGRLQAFKSPESKLCAALIVASLGNDADVMEAKRWASRVRAISSSHAQAILVEMSDRLEKDKRLSLFQTYASLKLAASAATNEGRLYCLSGMGDRRQVQTEIAFRVFSLTESVKDDQSARRLLDYLARTGPGRNEPAKQTRRQ